MDSRIPAWLAAAGIAACVAAYVWRAGDEPARAAAAAPGAVAADHRPSWFDSAALMPHPADASAQEAEQIPGRPLVGHNGRVVDLGGLDVARYIAQREGAARLGDMKAVYEVYQAEALCANTDQPVPDTVDPADHARLERARERQRALCANISPTQVQERLHYLRLAADGGNAEAQIDYFMEGPGQPVDAEAGADDPLLKQWKQDAMAYLKTAGTHCNAYALSLVSNAYDAGSIVERDPGLVMAYGVAAARARGVERTPEQWRQQFGDGLPDAQADAALKLGNQLADGACQR